MVARVDIYSTTYKNFASDVRTRIRQEVFGEDIGQHSWTTAAEQLHFATVSALAPLAHVLEIGCGAGGPAMFLAARIGVRVTGLDINPAAIETARTAAERAELSNLTDFVCGDGGSDLPFAAASFEAVHLIDAINHIPDRQTLLREINRVLRPGGSLLYTDPVVVTGAVSSEEIAARSSIGYFVFLPPGENERMLKEAGFVLEATENVTASMVTIAGNWIVSRQRWSEELISAEGLEPFEYAQKFSTAVRDISASGKLSRLMFKARKP